MSLPSQLRFIEQAHAQGQLAQAAALETLFVQTHPNGAMAWCDLAHSHLHAGRLPDALTRLQKAHAMDAGCLSALDGLAQVHAALRQLDQARHYGCLALDAKDALTAEQVPPVAASLPTQAIQRVIAFSLFGQDAFYSEGAVRNAADAQRYYPGWSCRFYVTGDVSQPVRERLQAHGAQVLEPPIAYAHLPGTVWRFLPFDEEAVATVICRDADSVMGEREAQAVQEWLSSGQHAHVMRDNYQHTELMLAGLWGAHCARLRGIGAALVSCFEVPRHPTHADQHFLRDWVWPRLRDSVLQHDRCYRWRDAAAFKHALVNDSDQVGNAPFETITLPTVQNDGQAYNLQVVEPGGEWRTLGNYRFSVTTPGMATQRLPLGYASQIQSGAMRLVPYRSD